MNEHIGRNDLCPCGSGKKYKKCCGAGEAISITYVIENEIAVLQQQIIRFAYNHYGDELEYEFGELTDFIDLEDEEESEIYQYVHAVWYTFFEELEDGGTIIEKFIQSSEGKNIKRPKLKQILQTWTEARTIAGKIIHIDRNKLTVENGLTKEQQDIIIADQQDLYEEGVFFVGIIVPYGQNFAFFPAPFDIPELKAEQAFAYIEGEANEEGYDDVEEYLQDYFVEIMNELPMIGSQVDIAGLAWPGQVYQEVAETFREQLEREDAPAPIIDMGVVLWFQFCEKKLKKIQNPNLYAASLHYLVSEIADLVLYYSQQEIAEIYHVSGSSLSSVYREMKEVLADNITELNEILEDEDGFEIYPEIEEVPAEDWRELDGDDEDDFNSDEEGEPNLKKK